MLEEHAALESACALVSCVSVDELLKQVIGYQILELHPCN